MGDMNTALGNVVLGVVAMNSIGQGSARKGFVHPGMHINLLINGALGALKHGGVISGDLDGVIKISMAASKYLPVASLMADMYSGFGDRADMIRSLHMLSGVIPFVLTVVGKENPGLGKVCIIGNILSLVYYAANKRDNTWAWGTAGAAVFSYFCAEKIGPVAYPLGLAAMNYCAYRMYTFVAVVVS